MSGKSISFISVKGGVGKTTISVNVAEELAERVSGSDKVLVLDLDAQAGSSLYILGDDRLRQLEGKTLYHLMRAKLGGTRLTLQSMSFRLEALGALDSTCCPAARGSSRSSRNY
ncbi:MAG: AAA family ATPase [Thermofilum sp.]